MTRNQFKITRLLGSRFRTSFYFIVLFPKHYTYMAQRTFQKLFYAHALLSCVGIYIGSAYINLSFCLYI